jgi:hypothetical protein
MRLRHGAVAHNLVHDLPYTGISIGWEWSTQPTPCRENVVEANHVYDTSAELVRFNDCRRDWHTWRDNHPQAVAGPSTLKQQPLVSTAGSEHHVVLGFSLPVKRSSSACSTARTAAQCRR